MIDNSGVPEIISRMAKREAVLYDQAQGLVGKYKGKSSYLGLLFFTYHEHNNERYPVEAAFVSGREREPNTVFSCVIKPDPEWKIDVPSAADGLKFPFSEAISNGKTLKSARRTIVNLAGQKPVYVFPDKGALSHLKIDPDKDINFEMITDEEKESLKKMPSISSIGRALPDAICLYRILRYCI